MKDKPYSFASRDFLIKHCVGKTIRFQVLYNIPSGVNREYGRVILPGGISFPETSVSEGWVKVREDAGKRMEETDQTRQFVEKLELEQAKAKADSKGVWSKENDGRIQVQQDLPDAKAFVEEHKDEQLQAVVERVLTGDRVILRFIISPQQHIQAMVLLAGIRAPATKRANPSDGKEQPAEPYAEEALQFLDSRILQRTVHVRAVGTTPQGQLVCSIAHQQGGDMAGHILRAGLARCVDHHSTMLGGEMAKLRQAEKEAKDKKVNLFKGHVATAKANGGDVEVIVTKVQTADTIFVRSRGGADKKIALSSIRQPKPTDPKQSPFQAEAKEFLRKKLIGKHVKVSVDGVKAASEGYEERQVATVTQAGKNIALQLVEAGWASVIRHRRDDSDRSPHYDELLAAEEVAQKEGKGLWSGKPSAAKHYVDYSESAQKAKIQASILQRQRRIPAIIDFVKGPSRFVVLIPRENAKLTLVLSGIRAPKAARNPNETSDPFAPEALEFANRKCLQRDVEIDIEGTDKVGGFVGTIYINRENFTKLLVEEGYASVHGYSAENSPHGVELFAAEKTAKDARRNIWQDYDPSQDQETEETPTNGTNGDASVLGRKIEYKEVAITHIDPETLKLKLQIVGTGTGALEELMTRFRTFHVSNQTNQSKDYTPKVGDLVSAKFSEDKTWYRARIRRSDKDNKASDIIYIDYGNEEKLAWSELRALPQQFDVKTLRPQAQEAVLSFLQFPTSQQYRQDTASFLYKILPERNLIANIDHTDTKDGTLYVTLFDKDLNIKQTENVNAEIVTEGYAMVPKKLRAWEQSGDGAQDILQTLQKKEKEAKDERRGMWEYGDITEDD